MPENMISKKILVDLLFEKWTPNISFHDLILLISEAEKQTKEEQKNNEK